MTTLEILSLISLVALILWNLPRMIEISRGKPILLYIAIWLGILLVIGGLYQITGGV